jgi:TM2 domain-containing membrane protein YozV
MPAVHINKTLTSLLAFLAGGLGAHRFYLRGSKDRWAWVHLSAVPAALLVATLFPDANRFYKVLPLIVSSLVGFLEALVLGLMPDQQWDAAYNVGSGKLSGSNWTLALLLVSTLMIGAGILIATISRLFDLLYTGGSYG